MASSSAQPDDLPGWNVFAGYTFLDAKILKSNDTQVVEGVTYSLQGSRRTC